MPDEEQTRLYVAHYSDGCVKVGITVDEGRRRYALGSARGARHRPTPGLLLDLKLVETPLMKRFDMNQAERNACDALERAGCRRLAQEWFYGVHPEFARLVVQREAKKIRHMRLARFRRPPPPTTAEVLAWLEAECAQQWFTAQAAA